LLSVSIKRAPALQKGDRVRLVAPASPFDQRAFECGVKAVARLGFEPVYDRAEFKRTGFLAGSDEERARRFGRALMDPDASAVWFIRGGYGSARMLPLLKWKLLRRYPKVVIGFSDTTAVLQTLTVPGGYVTVHGPVVTQLPKLPGPARQWLKKLVTKPDPAGKVPLGALKTITPGKINGFLTGGNLATLASLVGTPYFPELAGSILFIEDTGEEAYRLDRMFNQLVQAGVLKNVFGVVIGNLAGCKPAGAGKYSARKTLERAVAQLDVPAVSGAAFGHASRNVALPLGVMARLDASRRSLTLLEPAVHPSL
jgi:muramoyltetrapeptide carboxypeptidase